MIDHPTDADESSSPLMIHRPRRYMNSTHHDHQKHQHSIFHVWSIYHGSDLAPAAHAPALIDHQWRPHVIAPGSSCLRLSWSLAFCEFIRRLLLIRRTLSTMMRSLRFTHPMPSILQQQRLIFSDGWATFVAPRLQRILMTEVSKSNAAFWVILGLIQDSCLISSRGLLNSRPWFGISMQTSSPLVHVVIGKG